MSTDYDVSSAFAQHDQSGPSLPPSLSPMDPADALIAKSGNHPDDPPAVPTSEQVREDQKIDLVMLRLAYRSFYEPKKQPEPAKPVPRRSKKSKSLDPVDPPPDVDPPPPIPGGDDTTKIPESAIFDSPLFSVAEFSHLVNAVSKFHEEERLTFDLNKPTTPTPDKEHDGYDNFSKLTKQQVIDLCYDNNILPPDLCRIDDAEQPLHPAG